MYYIYTRRRLCTTFYILEGGYVLHFIYYKEIMYYIYATRRLYTTYILEGDYVLHIYLKAIMYYIYTRRRLCTTYYILEGD